MDMRNHGNAARKHSAISDEDLDNDTFADPKTVDRVLSKSGSKGSKEIKRGPGRPPNSKNKKVLVKEVTRIYRYTTA